MEHLGPELGLHKHQQAGTSGLEDPPHRTGKIDRAGKDRKAIAERAVGKVEAGRGGGGQEEGKIRRPPLELGDQPARQLHLPD